MPLFLLHYPKPWHRFHFRHRDYVLLLQYNLVTFRKRKNNTKATKLQIKILSKHWFSMTACCKVYRYYFIAYVLKLQKNLEINLQHLIYIEFQYYKNYIVMFVNKQINNKGNKDKHTLATEKIQLFHTNYKYGINIS